jgi:hypothetical protein
MADPACLAKGIPERLHTESRPADQQFEKSELLYRWLSKTYPRSELKESFRLVPDESVNRQKYSKYPADVLFDIKDGNHRIGQAILPFEVGQLECDITHQKSDEAVIYSFRILHKPEQCMYPHCAIEVRSKGEIIHNEKKIPGIVRRQLRKAIADAQEKNILYNPPLPTD